MDLEAAKRASTLQLLIRCARLVDERARSRIVDDAGRVLARQATMALVPHIAFEGTRVVDLAEKLGITKQAVSRRVAELEELGVVALEADPLDGRAKRVCFTPRGLEAIAHGLGVLGQVERELAADLGTERMAELRCLLADLSDLLDRGASGPGGPAAGRAEPGFPG